MEAIRMKRGNSALLVIPLSVALVALTACGANSERPADDVAGTVGTSEPLDDTRIEAAVQTKVFSLDGLSSRNVTVLIENGVATLRGFVETEEMKMNALKVAAEAEGVTRVIDELTIEPGWRSRLQSK
jgi:osmotically-inducible protein OsmY